MVFSDLPKKALIVDTSDVLVTKLLHNQDDLYQYIEKTLQIPGFQKIRANAENAVRLPENDLIKNSMGLDLIYGLMYHSYQPIKEKEIELQLLTTKINPEIKEFIKLAQRNSVPVYLFADSFLEKDILQRLLKEHNCDCYQRFYVIMDEKSKCSAYQEILSETGADPSDILHITRALTYNCVSELGISILPYESIYRRLGQNKNSTYFALMNQYASADIAIPLLQGNIAFHCLEQSISDDWVDFGYKYIGILAFEYVKYLGNIAKEIGIKRLFFFSENGCALRQVCNLLLPEIKTKMLGVSERALSFLNVHDLASLIEAVTQDVAGNTTFGVWLSWLMSMNKEGSEEEYPEYFPHRNKVISSEDDLNLLRRFITDNYDLLIAISVREQENVDRILHEEDAFLPGDAIVSLGMNQTLLSELSRYCSRRFQGHETMIFWWEYGSNIHWQFDMLSMFKSKTRHKNVRRQETCKYLKRILDATLFDSNSVTPEDSNFEKASKATPAQRAASGMMDCIQDLRKIDEKFPIPLSNSAALACCEYLQNHISRSDEVQLETLLVADGPYGGMGARPLFRQDAPTIGIANPWPQDVSAEAEVITRIKRTAAENGIKSVLLDGYGHILNDKQGVTKDFVKDGELSFVITTHYECPKLLNTFYYNPLWNPPEIPLNLNDYTPRVTNYFLTNDDFLIYDSGGMTNHLRSILMNCHRTLEGASALTASFPVSAALAPYLDKPIMFYCGMNWEVMFGGAGRHDGLFRLLDDSQKVKIYGPERVEAWGGLEPWKGYRCYQGMIPFDGFSILEKINECGVCLVLSSDTHRRAGAATNRLYEACAAGAVIISDDNEFVLQHFSDAALFITFNKNDPIDTFQQIMEKYKWIVEHPEEALALARRAQEIFIQRFSLDAQLNQIVSNHPARFNQISKDLYAKNEDGKVLVTFILDTQDEETAKDRLDQVFSNIHEQLYRNLELAVVVDPNLSLMVEQYGRTHCDCVNTIAMDLFDKKGVRAMTDGQAVRAAHKLIPHQYFINTTAEETWFYDHITTLVREIQDQDCIGAYSASAFQDVEGIRRINFFDKLDATYLYDMEKPDHPLTAGQFLFRAEAHDMLPDYLFGSLDGLEHIAYAGVTHYCHDAKLAFNKRMSLTYTNERGDERCAILEAEMQRRFIRDLIHLHLPERRFVPLTPSAGIAGGIDKRNVTDLFLYMPLKTYIRLRYYRFRMRRKKPGTPKYKKYAAKYDACLEEYRSFWNV